MKYISYLLLSLFIVLAACTPEQKVLSKDEVAKEHEAIINVIKACGQGAYLLIHHPIAREAGNYASANQRNQNGDHSQSQTLCKSSGDVI